MKIASGGEKYAVTVDHAAVGIAEERAVGVAVQWLAPLGLFRFSLAVPLNAQHGNGITTWGDQTEAFQFSVGNAF